MPLSLDTCIKVGARSSALSQAQTIEVLDALRKHHPEVDFEIEAIETTGDRDQQTSLRSLDKTDFFTKEIDKLLLDGQCRIAIHSAKDLPDPLPPGIAIAAITSGVDPRDALVLRPNETLKTGMRIATSSERREAAASELCSGLHFTDIRGNIQQRLEKLQQGDVDGVVIAEAALIRLGLTELNRHYLPGKTAELQGRLAILCRSDDHEMAELFQCLDTRTRCLYLGLELPPQPHDTLYTHYPVIATLPRTPGDPKILEAFRKIPEYTHVIFTSKSGVRTFFQLLGHFNCAIDHLKMIAVGSKTAAELKQYGITEALVAKNETAEGIVELLQSLDLTGSNFFWPHSALSRTVISSFLKAKKLTFTDCIVYDTVPCQLESPPSLDRFDAISFTSPSTVKAFIQIFGSIPKDKTLNAIGPITQEAIELYRSLH